MRLYCIYDTVAEEASAPFIARTDGQAVRIFLYAMEKDKAYAQDYKLYKIGGWNSENMAITGISKPEIVKISDGIDELEATDEREAG